MKVQKCIEDFDFILMKNLFSFCVKCEELKVSLILLWVIEEGERE